MPIRSLLLRATKYIRRHGLKSSMKRAWRESRNQFLQNRLVLYWMDLVNANFEGYCTPDQLRIERCDKSSEVPERLINRIAEQYSEELLQDNIRTRFEKGARLWILGNDTEDIGYIWSITGRTLQPQYFFPLMACDIHLDDGLIFSNYRGHGLLCVLISHILKYYKGEGFHRCYLEVAEWNAPSMKSVAKIGFTRIGLARMRFRRGKCMVTWWYGKDDKKQ